jgi:transcriptional regulator with XRE-family HTH domain
MTRIPPMKFLGPAVRNLRKMRSLTLEEVANQVEGYDSGNMSRFERGVQSIDSDKLKAIAAIFGTTVSEIYSLAEALESATTPGESTSVAHQVSEPSRPYAGGGSLAISQASTVKRIGEVERHPFEEPTSAAWEFVLVPSIVMTRDPAGRAVVAVDQQENNHAIPRAIFDPVGVPLERARVIAAPDDAMAPTLAAGDLALLDIGDTTIQTGRVYALIIQDEIWIRRLLKTPTGVTLTADNKAGPLPDHHLTVAEFQDIQVIGRLRLRWGSAGL